MRRMNSMMTATDIETETKECCRNCLRLRHIEKYPPPRRLWTAELTECSELLGPITDGAGLDRPHWCKYFQAYS